MDELEVDVCGVVFIGDCPWDEGMGAIGVWVYGREIRGIVCEGSDT